MLAGKANALCPERVLRFIPNGALTRRHGHFALALFGLMGSCDDLASK